LEKRKKGQTMILKTKKKAEKKNRYEIRKGFRKIEWKKFWKWCWYL